MQYCKGDTVGRTKIFCPAYCFAFVRYYNAMFVRPTVLLFAFAQPTVLLFLCLSSLQYCFFVRPTVLRLSGLLYCLSSLLYCLSGLLCCLSSLLYCYWVCPAYCTSIGFVRPFVRPTVLLLGLSGLLYCYWVCPAVCLAYSIAFVCLSVVRIFTDKPYFFYPTLLLI